MATKKDALYHILSFVRYKPDPFNLTAHLRLFHSCRHFYELDVQLSSMTIMVPPPPLVAENVGAFSLNVFYSSESPNFA